MNRNDDNTGRQFDDADDQADNTDQLSQREEDLSDIGSNEEVR